jgi:predicted alpha/beta-fold hydrolase
VARRPRVQANTMDAFIERVICKVYHHATPTLDEYFRASRAHTHIPLIRTPTLFLGAADDPFLGALPAAEASANPYTLLALTARCARPSAGGRLGGCAGCIRARTRCTPVRLRCFWACRVSKFVGRRRWRARC